MINKNACKSVFIYIGGIVMKRFFVYLIAFMSLLAARAETVSQKQAQQLAHLFFNEAAGRVTAPPKLIYNGRKLTTGRLFTPFYVYNTSLGGFVIISAENKAYPILGFSLKDNFDPERIGETEKELLISYANEIELVRYDTTPVDGAIWAWQHYADYVHSILNAPYIATDPKLTLEEAQDVVERGVEKDDAIYSDMYTPEQWRDMILDELRAKESVPLVIVGIRELFPMVAYGYQGDYFRLEMSKRNSWLMRLNATEVVSSAMISVVGNPLQMLEEEELDIPFQDHDAFLAEVNRIEDTRAAVSSIDLPVFDDKPLVRPLGSGHYEILLPEPVASATVYNIAGAILKHQTFHDTNVANIDIASEPTGFYFVRVVGESGTPYGLKIYR